MCKQCSLSFLCRKKDRFRIDADFWDRKHVEKVGKIDVDLTKPNYLGNDSLDVKNRFPIRKYRMIREKARKSFIIKTVYDIIKNKNTHKTFGQNIQIAFEL